MVCYRFSVSLMYHFLKFMALETLGSCSGITCSEQGHTNLVSIVVISTPLPTPQPGKQSWPIITHFLIRLFAVVDDLVSNLHHLPLQ